MMSATRRARRRVCDNCGGELYQRVDDRPETIARRLEAYTQTTMPLIAYYQQQGVLREIDGHGSIQDITAALLREMEPGPTFRRERRLTPMSAE